LTFKEKYVIIIIEKEKRLILMTVTELKTILEKFEKEGKGDCKICVVSSSACEPISEYYNKYVTDDIDAYFDSVDGTVTITD
jgi:hypothetical protein